MEPDHVRYYNNTCVHASRCGSSRNQRECRGTGRNFSSAGQQTNTNITLLERALPTPSRRQTGTAEFKLAEHLEYTVLLY
jgi:hypothetical protein